MELEIGIPLDFLLQDTLSDEEAPDRFAYQIEIAEQLGEPPSNAIRIEGYGALWGVKDTEGAVFRRGAFSESLRLSQGAAGVLMHLQHAERWPVGLWTHIEEDARGLLCRGAVIPRLAGPELIRAIRDKQDPIRGLSPGFYSRTPRGFLDPATIKKVWLTEISVGRGPVLAGATFSVLNR